MNSAVTRFHVCGCLAAMIRSRTHDCAGTKSYRQPDHRSDQGHESRTSFHITPEDRQAPPRHLQARDLAKGCPEPSSSGDRSGRLRGDQLPPGAVGLVHACFRLCFDEVFREKKGQLIRRPGIALRGHSWRVRTMQLSSGRDPTGWRLAFRRGGIEVRNAFLHRCIGMRGDLLISAVFKEIGPTYSERTGKKLERLHTRYFDKMLPSIKPVPGAVGLLKTLSLRKLPWAIATGGKKRAVIRMIRPLPVPATVPVVTADDVDQARPEPDVFLVAARRLGVSLSDCIVVGDSILDLLGARRAKALGVGLLSGGYGSAELTEAGAYRVYEDAADLLEHLAEIGIDAR